MRLKPEQLDSALQKRLAPVYLITGDEPLQVNESADSIRLAARNQGFTTREILSADASFSWEQLTFSANSLSLFAEKKIIDLRLSSNTPGAEGSKAIQSFCERVPDDTLLLITLGKLPSAAFKSRWLEAIEKVGIIIQIWPLEGHDLLRWLQQRMQKKGINAEPEALKSLALQIEGNLLAAAQEIEKLYILYGAGYLSNRQVLDAVADNSRFDVFKLVDSILSSDANRIYKILSALHVEGVAAPIVLWGLTREARTLLKIRQAIEQGQNKENVLKNNQVWDKRKSLVEKALSRLNNQSLHQILVQSAKADRQIKGQQAGNCWETLLEISLLLASKSIT